MKAAQPRSRPQMRLATVCVDCADTDVMADFFGHLLGWEVTAREPDWVLMRDPNGVRRSVDRLHQASWRQDAVALGEELRDLGPINVGVEHHADFVRAPGRPEERVA